MAAAACQPCPPVLSTSGEVQAVCANMGVREVTAMQTNRVLVLIFIMFESSTFKKLSKDMSYFRARPL
jgi:hypothetical protein